jgi:hypothetical protein
VLDAGETNKQKGVHKGKEIRERNKKKITLHANNQ